jgi:subtilisin family serine protease
MRSNRFTLLLILCLVAIFSVSLAQQTRQGSDSKQRLRRPPRIDVGKIPRVSSQASSYAQDHILVKFDPSLSIQSIRSTLTEYNAVSQRILPGGIHVLQIADETTVEEMIYIMRQHVAVEYAEPDYIARISVTPNDTFFANQWALYNTGQEIPVPGSPTGKERADIKATSAWEETKGRTDVVIAVIDTGVDLDHPDLRNKLVSSGKDFVNEDDDASDDHSHGTFVAGLAAAETDNGIGIAGVAWNCSILPVKCMDEEGEGLYSWIIDGIDYAINQGVHVINLSLGGASPSDALEEVVGRAYSANIPVIASVGNDAEGVLYPAAYDAYVLAVAATDYNDVRPSWSNTGPEVDVAAPGDLVLSTVPTWYFGPGSIPYGLGSGTSFACPHAAGMIALIISQKDWLTVDDLWNILRYTADDVNADELPGFDEEIGYGRINMDTAVVPINIKKRP